MAVIDEVRSFNRFYTREIGLLAEHLPASALTLAEARILYELAQAGELTAAELTRMLSMDKAHVSRIVGRFRARGMVQRRPSPTHAKRLLLSLTEEGRQTFASLDEGTQAQIEALLSPLASAERDGLVAAMRGIRAVLEPRRDRAAALRLRGLRPGDLGWITHRQAVLYHREYGWDWTYEGLVSQVLSDFVAGFDPAREDAWVAELDGNIVGSIFLVKGDEPGIAKLRLLYVEPKARGLGVGTRLVRTCIERAREIGYVRLTLWTNDVLAAARRIYQAAGFQLSHEVSHRSFGHDLVGQTWTLDLAATPPRAAAGPRPE